MGNYINKLFTKIGNGIRHIIDFVYYPFRRYFDIHFFRYGVCGASNLVFDWALYFLVYNFILRKQMLHLGFITLSSPIASLALTFPITVCTGFLLQKYVTFSNKSSLHSNTQLFRYLTVVLTNLFVIYVGLKFFVEVLGFYPTPSKILITLLTVAFSYYAQKNFIFKK